MSKTLAVFLSPLSAAIALLMVGLAAASVMIGIQANVLGDVVAASRFGTIASALIEIYLAYLLLFLPLLWVLSGAVLGGMWFLRRKGYQVAVSLPEHGRMAWFALLLSIPVTLFTSSLPLGGATGLIALLTLTGLVLCGATSAIFFQFWQDPQAARSVQRSVRSPSFDIPMFGAGAAA